MLTLYQQELLRRLEIEIDKFLAQSPRLDTLLARLKAAAQSAVNWSDQCPPATG
jgi:hypothetical protein